MLNIQKSKPAFCIHAHFYQPPREDPLTGSIPIEPGATPFNNWNERINDQCYRPNAELGNFGRISFDLGPTLAMWLERYDSFTYARIIDQAKQVYERDGVSNAMAQAFNHTILPLATRQEKQTQIRWGIKDYIHRYGWAPRGMWLPETAVDLETLELCVENGIQFTILAPWQVEGKPVHSDLPYKVNLPNGSSITVFFYNQDLSNRVSFDSIATENADAFVKNFVIPKSRLSKRRPESRFLLAASDGEAYGHHHAFRDKFLAYLTSTSIPNAGIDNSYPAKWLIENGVTQEINIKENTSWSCHHGVKRWSDICDCTPNGDWKKPLGAAFRMIATYIDKQFVTYLQKEHKNPDYVREEYIAVILHRISEDEFVEREFSGISDGDKTRVKQLLKAQYERQRMFTSCAWFFDDFDRIEPRNNVAYAAAAVWLTEKATGSKMPDELLAPLRNVKSWRSGLTADLVFNHHTKRLGSTSY